jgi:hypothetical protein
MGSLFIDSANQVSPDRASARNQYIKKLPPIAEQEFLKSRIA